MSKFDKLLQRIKQLDKGLRFDEVKKVLLSYGYELKFDHPEYAQEVYDEYRNQTPITPYDGMNTLTGANHLIAAKCGDVGVIAGGDRMEVVTHNGLLSEEDIATLSKKWWEYWKDYWRLRKTQNAYQKDWACEVTIPVSQNNP